MGNAEVSLGNSFAGFGESPSERAAMRLPRVSMSGKNENARD